jgi:UDP-N-acetylmuramoyl-tripeptide--D-alanyl-D-alanine ligase
MFLTEYYQSGWKNAATFGDFVLLLSHWVIHTHEILLRTKNTGYAFEGIISAYEIAKHRQDEATLRRLEAVIDQGLHKLCTWQVGGPLAHENPYLVKNPTSEKIAVGGIMGASNEADLRIDTTQHQMHALIMALTTVYTK